ncbi:MAG: hypothetical protein WC725_01715 [Patescibacteria group bacterium]|jgi:hypothetical protein
MPEKYTPPGAENFQAPKSKEEPLFDEKDLDMDELFGDAKAGEMLQSEKIIKPEDEEES